MLMVVLKLLWLPARGPPLPAPEWFSQSRLQAEFYTCITHHYRIKPGFFGWVPDPFIVLA